MYVRGTEEVVKQKTLLFIQYFVMEIKIQIEVC